MTIHKESLREVSARLRYMNALATWRPTLSLGVGHALLREELSLSSLRCNRFAAPAISQAQMRPIAMAAWQLLVQTAVILMASKCRETTQYISNPDYRASLLFRNPSNADMGQWSAAKSDQ
ncbi:hypothetical protein E2553_13160 [Paraburkholderia dipogonis]|uniref:Uncharacterized protein n=1 Tax=Paraburkholderia dipogonis TaxID=1211383 RepID=A0A4Y8N800_9BURK|nr:hypothetical protein [Paraburkholderia dipogonis]TFE45887.1 hypothetical protein E2553_13160 [Paraburkholderia dipogonis]